MQLLVVVGPDLLNGQGKQPPDVSNCSQPKRRLQLEEKMLKWTEGKNINLGGGGLQV